MLAPWKKSLREEKNNLTVASTCPSERKNQTSFSLNPRVEIVKLLKKTFQKPRQGRSQAFHIKSWSSCEHKGKVLKENQKCSSTEHMHDKKAKLTIKASGKIGLRRKKKDAE